MNGTEEVAKRIYEACLSGSVETLKALIEKDPLILDRASSTECFSSDTPLHVAALRGPLEFTNALLNRKSTLAAELDSRRCTPPLGFHRGPLQDCTRVVTGELRHLHHS
ncbi:hypothetical protein RHMOL_Rhmol03G0066700 [Rhododendron molle]|uniref:Uncharacterized protein n=1 Tax=Rhododendron molle TaxID=49168 RepID=A0ACC0PBB6_RHOML|nr:hypothetical protein RHMOL_Rhmol03G0066700 [Rhododendron molle]